MNVEELIQKHSLRKCLQCGLCSGSCPVSKKSGLNIRNFMREISLFGQLITISQDALWSCTTCSTCGIRCPKEIVPYEFLIDIRTIAVEDGNVSPTIRDALESTFKHGNPWGRIRNKRFEWAKDLNIKNIAQGAEFLYFVGCTPSYDLRIQDVSKSLVKCFEKGKVDFGVLGNKENCCGAEIYGMGEKGLFDFLVEENMNLFQKYKIKKIVTSCPHSFNTFKKRYGQNSIEVLHHTQLLASLIDKGHLIPSNVLAKKVIYHDPCYLGKQNGVYEEPRKVIESLPGVQLLEFDRAKERSLCCEGSGGRMWIDISGKRLAEERVNNAIAYGADILAVSCPFCLLTLEDAVKTTGHEGEIEVMDVSELVALTI